ncbi:TPA: dATP/dGTP pyrophosphohydrolase domain-containing protein, partial [Salmonella enterica subsp. enterica serovar Onderstepoort]
MTTITSKFTKERLIDWAVVAVAERGRDLKDAPESVEAAANLKLAEIALAQLIAEPVAYNQVQRDIMKDIIVRKLGGNLLGDKLMMADIHAVTMALIQAGFRTAPPASERERIRREHAEWSDATFGNVGPVGPLKHLSKEALEAAADPSDPLEWADMQFLLWDAQRRMGISDEFITRAMIEKLAVNKKREWPGPKDGEPRLHIKEQPESVVPVGLRMALSNAGIAAPESDEMLAATHEKYIQALVTWVKDRKPFQPAPVVPEECPEEIRDLMASHSDALFNDDDVQEIWNACRAAMLQANQRDLSQPVAPQVAEYEQIMLQAGNSPVSPDGWISCSERMPAQDDWVLIYSKYGEYLAGQVQGEYVELNDGTLSWLGAALHWMPLPAAPEPEQ